MEQLGDERLGQRLDLLAHLRVLRIEPAKDPFSLLQPNLLPRECMAVRTGLSCAPCRQASNSVTSSSIMASTSGTSRRRSGEIPVQPLLQGVEVVQPYSGEFANLGIHIARHGQVHQGQVISPTTFDRRLHHLSTDHCVRRCGQSQNDVSRAKRLTELLPGQGTRADRRAQGSSRDRDCGR